MDCSVCYERTSSKLMCNHYLCEICCIKYILDYSNFVCPVCRRDLYITVDTWQFIINHELSNTNDGNKKNELNKLISKVNDEIKNIESCNSTRTILFD